MKSLKKNGISESQFWKSLEKFRQEQELEIEPEVFANVRDTSPTKSVFL
ncbi:MULTISPECIES: hypothetical protein [Cyanophyceae]|nr:MULTISPECIES: hypothetical protein [Cyanophyceae]MDB9356745.1 hypothetical protein [Nodularia spumigena CS-587/03]MDB9304331.1 hypothetical protein [Nodularia spumigena CS-591/12]MDB9322196.1 hypothetical protein [Nodularia spumigena CS-591/07A]MDB9329156.1 hypothetical protein [Nodularia spumigena CS-591/04]MDB9340095.1 hypothetical protein [Nodularia spumigena CS-589/07]